MAFKLWRLCIFFTSQLFCCSGPYDFFLTEFSRVFCSQYCFSLCFQVHLFYELRFYFESEQNSYNSHVCRPCMLAFFLILNPLSVFERGKQQECCRSAFVSVCVYIYKICNQTCSVTVDDLLCNGDQGLRPNQQHFFFFKLMTCDSAVLSIGF